MQPDASLSALERAFALADEGKRVTEIRVSLGREGYDQRQLNSPALARQLTGRARAARDKN